MMITVGAIDEMGGKIQRRAVLVMGVLGGHRL
jgi:hypothetical protein